MVAPAGQSPLFGCRAYLILKIAVRLCKGLTSQRVQFFDAGQRVVHIPDQHIEKHLCGLHAAFFQPFYGLAHIVADGGAVVSHADITHPFHPREQFGDWGIPGDLPGIKSLIEVYAHPSPDNLLDLLQSPPGRKYVVVEQYGIAASVQKFFYVSISPQCALFSGNHAPRAAIHASAGQKTYCRRIVIQPVIRAGVFDLRGQHGRIVPIPSSALYYLAGESVRIIGCECKYFGHIHPVVLPEHGVGKLHAVAVRFVSCRKFHQGEVREVVAVYVYQSYLHGLLL